MKKLKVIGLLLLLTGIIFVFDSQVGITGFVVAENYGARFGTLIGMVLIIGGVVLFGISVDDYLKEIEEYQTGFEKIRPQKRTGQLSADEVGKEAIRYLEKIKNGEVNYEECIGNVVEIIQSGISTSGRSSLPQIDHLAKRIQGIYPSKEYNQIRIELGEEIHNE